MPNWAKGSLKLRGRSENIVSALKEMLLNDTVTLEYEYDGTLLKFNNTIPYFYINGTRRAFMIVCINLNSRINDLNNKFRDLEWTVQEHELSIQRMAEKNNEQDVILNKLNSEYQMREKQRAEEVKEAAERNGVGG